MKAMTIQENSITQVDAIEGLKQLPDNSVDLIVTDPPYNIASKSKIITLQGKLQTTDEAFGEWDTYHPFDFDNLIRQLISEAYRVLKPGAGFYMFTARESNARFIEMVVKRGFTYRNVIAMTKSPSPSIYKNHWRSGFDLCLYATKGKSRTRVFNFLTQAEMSNVQSYSPRNKVSKHPTEKPLELIERIIRVSSNPGDLVVDPFLGSGTTAVAAKKLGRKYLGFELHGPYLKIIRDRLKKTEPEKREDSQESEAENAQGGST
ncbi:MAG: DNA-methyltransferase [Phycisphaeraceae bacterium]